MRRLTIIAAAALTLLPGVALAQDAPTGSRLGARTQAGRAGDLAEAMRASHTFARCINFTRDRTVRRWLTAVDSAEFANATREVFRPVDCESYIGFADPWADNFSLSSDLPTKRGTLAEAALRKDGALAPKAGPLPVLPLAEGYARPLFAMTGRSPAIDAMATCFAEAQPALVFALLQTKPTSAEEKAAVGAVVGQLSSCLIGGTKLKANAFTLRTSLAEAYFHRIHGPDAAPTPASTSAPASAKVPQ